MGITIHYSGRAKDFDSLTRLLETAQVFAARRDWMCAIYDDPLGVMDDHDPDDAGYIEHDGPYRGIVIRAHPECEPVRLNFRISHELTPAFTKTQFAPFEVHVEIVKLFREIAPFMERFEVVDEAGLWEDGDEAAARRQFRKVAGLIDALARKLGQGGGADAEPFQ